MNNDNFIGNVIDSKIYLFYKACSKKLSLNQQGRYGRQDCQDHGLAWILQNRTGRWKQMRTRDLASTLAILPAKNLP